MDSLFEREEGDTFSAYSETASELESKICSGLKYSLQDTEAKHGRICIREFCAIAHAAVSTLENELSYDRRRKDESRRHEERAANRERSRKAGDHDQG